MTTEPELKARGKFVELRFDSTGRPKYDSHPSCC